MFTELNCSFHSQLNPRSPEALPPRTERLVGNPVSISQEPEPFTGTNTLSISRHLINDMSVRGTG